MKLLNCAALAAALCFAFPVNAAVESRFAFGVSEDAGWYDVNKTFDGSDDDLCWAAAASNIIKWWQGFQTNVPAGTPAGDMSTRYSSDIFEAFANSYVNDGGFIEDGFNWWLTGYYDPADYVMKPGAIEAGFWKDIYPESDIFYQNLYLIKDPEETGLAMFASGSAWDIFTEAMTRNSQYGAAMGLAVYNDTGGAHALTLWGYDYDTTTGDILSLYIADSDNVDDDGQPHMEETMGIYDISYDNAEDRVVLGGDYAGWYIGQITFFGVNVLPIPEPSGILLCLTGGVMLLFKRRK